MCNSSCFDILISFVISVEVGVLLLHRLYLYWFQLQTVMTIVVNVSITMGIIVMIIITILATVIKMKALKKFNHLMRSLQLLQVL